MSKYANLPDIDTSTPDVYETEDVPTPSAAAAGDASDDDSAPARPAPTRGGRGAGAAPDELDGASLMSAADASRRFRKAERANEQRRARMHYTYPPSPTDESGPSHQPSAAYRLKQLQAELASLESELASAPADEPDAASTDGAPAPSELLQGLVDARGRLEKIGRAKDSRARRVDAVVQGRTDQAPVGSDAPPASEHAPTPAAVGGTAATDDTPAGASRSVAEMDRRVGALEALLGSSGAALDETTPLPPPLLPLVGRLSGQLTLLTQPRHIDAVSRRLKLLVSDLERASAHGGGRRGGGGAGGGPHATSSTDGVPAPAPAAHADALAPLLARLAPALPHIPHVLVRLRTLAALHAGAAEFVSALGALECEQRRARGALAELSGAVGDVERSLAENQATVGANIVGLEARVVAVAERLDKLEE